MVCRSVQGRRPPWSTGSYGKIRESGTVSTQASSRLDQRQSHNLNDGNFGSTAVRSTSMVFDITARKSAKMTGMNKMLGVGSGGRTHDIQSHSLAFCH